MLWRWAASNNHSDIFQTQDEVVGPHITPLHFVLQHAKDNTGLLYDHCAGDTLACTSYFDEADEGKKKLLHI